MDPYERSKLSDALKEESFKEGDKIIRDGDQGDKFFIIVAGTAIATKHIDGNEIKVMDYVPGGYFGERALITNEVRAANIVATSDCKCLSLERDTFSRLLGPLSDILKRNMDDYKKFNA
jgi:cAMP-dependent protein kinase regulator